MVSFHTKANKMACSLKLKDNASSSKIISPTLHEKSESCLKNSSSTHQGKYQVGHIKTRPTKTNRAFMLRQQLNTKNNEGRDLSETENKVKTSVATIEGGISRSAVGRHSARKPRGKHLEPRKEKFLEASIQIVVENSDERLALPIPCTDLLAYSDTLGTMDKVSQKPDYYILYHYIQIFITYNKGQLGVRKTVTVTRWPMLCHCNQCH